MHPILFKIGNFSIYSYGVVIACSIFVVSSLILRQGKKEGFSEEEFFNLIFLVVIIGLLGARLLHIMVHLAYYLRHPIEIIAIRHGGLAIQGGVIFGLLAAILFLRRRKLPILKTLDIFALYFPLAQAIGRIGCFLNGCCYGKEINFFLSVRFPFDNASRHPTQLYYSVSNFSIFLILFFLYRQRKNLSSTSENSADLQSWIKDGDIMLFYFMFYAVSRYSLDFLRDNLEPVFFSLYPTQVISFFTFLIAGGLLILRIIRRNNKSIK